MKNKKVRESNVFTTIIRVQGMDVLIEVFFYNGFKSYEYVFDLGFLFERIKPDIFSKMINKNYIILKAIIRNNR